MKFFLKIIIIGAILVALAGALWLNQDLLFSFNQTDTSGKPIGKTDIHHQQSIEPDAEKVAQESKVTIPKKSSNAAADGLSRYYANLYGDMDDDKPKIRNNIVYLPTPQGDLEKILEAKRLITRPLKRNWIGKTQSHPFRKGETLFQKLSEYANDNGLEVIWWLNRDFLVKDAFRVNKNIITTAFQVGKAVEGHFENGLSIYFCYQQRTIVLIEYSIDYLGNECMLLP